MDLWTHQALEVTILNLEQLRLEVAILNLERLHQEVTIRSLEIARWIHLELELNLLWSLEQVHQELEQLHQSDRLVLKWEVQKVVLDLKLELKEVLQREQQLKNNLLEDLQQPDRLPVRRQAQEQEERKIIFLVG